MISYPSSFDSTNYFKTPGVNRSALKYIDESYDRFLFELFNEQEPSTAAREGQLVHEIILEPEKIKNYVSDKEFVEAFSDKYKNPRMTKAYKEWKTDLEESGTKVLNELKEGKFLESAKKILLNLKKENLLEIINGCDKEREFFVESDGIIKKCKADLVLEVDENVFVYDIKTCANMLTHHGVEKYIRKYELHVQADWYSSIIQKALKKSVIFFVIMISKANMDAFIFRINPQMLEVGKFINNWRVNKIKEGQKGHWSLKDKFADRDFFFPEWYLKYVEEMYSYN